MTNTKLLNDYINTSGLKRQCIAEALGISPYTLAKKINNMTEFKASEVQKLIVLLNIDTPEALEAIFFAKEVDLKSTPPFPRLFSIWRMMLYRCYNPQCHGYKHYGGRGVKVCEEWRDDFAAFHDWAVANGYQAGLTLDRIDPCGNYEPGNCRWATMKEQGANRRPKARKQ